MKRSIETVQPKTRRQKSPARFTWRHSSSFGFSAIEISVILCFCVILWFAFFDKREVAISDSLEGGLASLNHSEIIEVSEVLGPDITVPLYESAALRRALGELNQYSESDREIWANVLQSNSDPASLLSAVDAASIANEIFSEPYLITQGFANSLELKLGETVRAIGGRIDSDWGTITLPVEVVFSEGSSEFEAQEIVSLRSVCLSWFELANRLPGVMRLVVEVDMPYSSASRGLPDSADYRHNLLLAQTRALNVLNFCLEVVENEQLFNWAFSNTVSFGRSSNFFTSTVDGDEEDLVRQRIVLRTDIDRYEVWRRRWD